MLIVESVNFRSGLGFFGVQSIRPVDVLAALRHAHVRQTAVAHHLADQGRPRVVRRRWSRAVRRARVARARLTKHPSSLCVFFLGDCREHHLFSRYCLKMYEFTFTIVDGVPKIDRREDLSDALNEQAEYMTRAIMAEYIVQFTSGNVRISLRED